MKQLTIFDHLNVTSLNDEIAKIINCNDITVLNACSESVRNFQLIPKEQKYVLSFSGGKDSHVLLAIYYLYLKLGNDPLDVVIRFADTELEHPSLYAAIDKTAEFCNSVGLPFEIVKGKKSYWYYQFAYGYPVPTFRIRWCTGKLKIDPIQTSRKIKAITGRHFGESNLRDQKLNKTCGSDTCGTDLVKDKYDPLIHWTNCLIWDAIFYFDGTLLYKGCFDSLQSQYKIFQDSKTGSLRLGCFMCPVIAMSTIEKNLANRSIDEEGYQVRLLLEVLRGMRRINNPRTFSLGSILIYDRRIIWEKLNKDYLIAKGFMSENDMLSISEAITSDYSYPVTYKDEWIDLEHKRILGNERPVNSQGSVSEKD